MDDSVVRIAVVRPDLLGTYGDGGNAVVLAQRLNWRGIPAELIVVGPGATVPSCCDVCVLGGGEDGAQIALAADRELGASLRRAADRGVPILGVCAGYQVLGCAFATEGGALHAGFEVLDCVTEERTGPRAVGEAIVDAERSDIGRLSGFENHAGRTRLGPTARPLGRVRQGLGNGDGTDGSQQQNVIGTYLHGPVLARCPALADAMLAVVVGPLEDLHLPQVETLRRERFASLGVTDGSTTGRTPGRRGQASPFLDGLMGRMSTARRWRSG